MGPNSLRYAKTHEWASLEGDVCTVGITRFAVDQLTDLLHLELPAVGAQVSAGQIFAEIESVKAASDLFAPVAGEVVAVNEKLVADPSPVADDPYGAGWMVKVKVAPGATFDHLLTAGQYQQQIASEEQ